MRLPTAGFTFLLLLLCGLALRTAQDSSIGRTLRPDEFYCVQSPSDQGLHKPPSLTVRLHKGPNDQAAWFMEVIVPTVFKGRVEWASLRAELAPQYEAICAQAQEDVVFEWSLAACAQDMMKQIEDTIRNFCVDGGSNVHLQGAYSAASDGGARGHATKLDLNPASGSRTSTSTSSSNSGAETSDGSALENIRQNKRHPSKGNGNDGSPPGITSPGSDQSARPVASPYSEATSSKAHARSKAAIAATNSAVVAAAATPSVSGWAAIEAEIKGLAALVVSRSSTSGEEEREDWVSVGRSSTQRCEAMRRFSKLFMGQAAAALYALHGADRAEEEEKEGIRGAEANVNGLRQSPSHAMKPLGGGSSSQTYRQALALLEGSHFAGNNASESWAALSRYALANLEHTIGAGRWDERVFVAAAARAAQARGAVVVEGDGGSMDGLVSVCQDRADVRATSMLLQAMHLSVPPALQSAFKDSGNYSTTLSSGSSRSISNERPATNACAASRKRTSPASSALSSSSSLVHVITVASEGPGHPKLAALEASAAAAGPCVVLHVLRAGSDARGGDYVKESAAAAADDGTGKDEAWGGNGWANDWKPRRLLAFLRDKRRSSMISKHDLVVFVDGYDVLLSLHIADLKDRMLTAHLHKPVTFAAEKTCWPDAALCKWLTASPYLNAGVFAGEKQHVLGMLEDMVHRLGEFAFCGEDQRAYQRYALERPDMIGLDTYSAVFQCMHGHDWEIGIEPPSHESTEAASRGQHGEKEASVWNTPLLYEVSGSKSPSAQSEQITEDAATKIARRPAVLHFNSYDGKEMMARLVEALREVAS